MDIYEHAATLLFQLLDARYRFTTYQDARRVRLVDGLIFETNILRVSPVKIEDARYKNDSIADEFEF